MSAEKESEKRPNVRPSKESEASSMGGQVGSLLTISVSFTEGLDTNLNMSGINDMGNDDEVTIYAAMGSDPTSREIGTTDRRAHYAPAPASFPAALDGGSWTGGQNYWVQVNDKDGTTSATWQGSVIANAGTLNIQLYKQ